MNQENLHSAADAAILAAGAGAVFLRTLAARRVAPDSDAIAGLANLDGAVPDGPQPSYEVVERLARWGSPAAAATAGGRFYGLVVGGTLPAALGARTLAASWDQVVFNEATSPVGVRLEQIAARWVLDLLQLPQDASVGFVTGATMANLTCLAAARHRLLARKGWNVEAQGLQGAPQLRVVASDEVHVTVLKALAMLGVGTNCVERIPCDQQGRLRSELLPKLDDQTIVLLQAGNVNSGAMDPIGEVCAQAARTGAWIHVDGAFGLWAAASPHRARLLSGHDAASSWVVDGHKWLNTPYDCGLAICRDPDAVHAAMATVAPYLKAGGAAAPKDMVPEFSRSARGVEVWAALASLGRSGVAELIERCCAHAQSLAQGLRKLGFDVLNDVTLNQVVATLPGHEGRMADLAIAVQNSGEAWFGPTTWQGRSAIRLSVSSWITSDEDVQRTLSAIQKATCELVS